MHFEENSALAEDHVVVLTNTSIDYLTALAIVDDTTIGDQVRSSIWEFIKRPSADELSAEEMTVARSQELRRPARISFPVNLLDSIERISAESNLPQGYIIDVALQRYIGRRLADSSLEHKITHRLAKD